MFAGAVHVSGLFRNLVLTVICVLAGCRTAPDANLHTGPRPTERAWWKETEVAIRPFDYEEIELDNGLRVITMEDSSSPIVAVQVWYHVGSKDEKPNRQGFAHMFEHMMFRGTDTVGPEDHFNLIHGTGGSNNAFTHFDFTAYVNTVPSNQLDLALWLEAERMMFLDISRDGFETERKVVEEERRQMCLNTPYGTIPERLLNVICTVHPYRWLPIGRIPHLRAAHTDELHRFWDKYYVPANATLVIVGAVTHDRAQTAARKFFDWMPKLDEPPRIDVVEPEQTEERVVTLRERLGPVPAVAYTYRTMPRNHPDAVPVEMMLRILAGGESSRLYSSLVKDRKLCAAIFSQDYTLEQDGIIGVIGALHPFKYVLSMFNPFQSPHSAITKAFDAHIEVLQRDGITEHELGKAKNQMIRGAVVDQRTVSGQAGMLGETSILYGTPDWLNRRIDVIKGVTRDDIQRVACKYMSPHRRTVARIKPDKRFSYDPTEDFAPDDYVETNGKLLKNDVSRPVTFPATPPSVPLLDEIPDPPTEEKTLDNGMKVVVIPNPEVPFVAGVIGFTAGAWTESTDRFGVAAMTLSMLTKGTEHHNADELADAIEFNALDLYGSATMDSAVVVTMGLSDKLPVALELLSEVVRHPVFPKDELRLLKRRRKIELMYQEKDPSFQASREFRRRVFVDHPYSRQAFGTRKDVGRIDRDSLVEWWRRYARPDAAVMYIGGDVTPVNAFRLAERNFADWNAEESSGAVDVVPFPDRRPTQIYIVDSPKSAQSQIRVGQTALSFHHPDWHVSTVFSQILGGAFGSRLNRTIRVEGGQTYGARGGFTAGRFGGRFVCSMSTETKSTGKTLRDMLRVIASMKTNPPSEDEMKLAKSYLVGRTPARYETALDVINAKWFIEHNGLPKDHLRQSIDQYKVTGTDDVVRVACEHVDPDSLTIVVVGDADEIRDELEAVAPVTVVK